MKASIIGASLLAAASLALASDGLEWSGYSRGGGTLGYNQDNGVQGGLSLGGDLQKFRLGNEGDAGIEVFVGKRFEAGDGLRYKLGYMPSKWGSGNVGTVQAFAEVSGLSAAPEARFWVGQRRLRIQDVHIVDHFLMNGGESLGAGVMDLAVGPVQLGLTVASANTFDRPLPAGTSASKLNLDVAGIGTNPGGTVRALLTAVSSAGFGSQGGRGLSLVHTQRDFLLPGLSHSLFVQTSSGLARITGEFIDLTVPAGSKALAVRGLHSSRIVDTVQWQRGAWGGQALAAYQRNQADGQAWSSRDSSLGARVSYAVSEHFKWLLEAGTTARRFSDGQPRQRLNKVTLAPTLAMGRDFWSRPELRLYLTRANWNDAAGAAHVGSPGAPGFASTDGRAAQLKGQTLVGVQYELWW